MYFIIIKNLNLMQLSHNILDGLDKLISNIDQHKRKQKSLELVKHFGAKQINGNDTKDHNLKDKKSFHQILAQTCQSIFDIILSQSEKLQFKQKLCPKRSSRANDSNEFYSPNSCNDWVDTLYEQMNGHPKCFIKLKNILKVDKIASIFETQLPCMETKQQKQQMHVSMLRRAIKQYSKKLWVNNQYVRCLDLERQKRGTRHITLFYIDELSSSMAQKQQILALFEQHFQMNKIEDSCQLQLQVQVIESCVEPSAKPQFYQSNLWQQDVEFEIDNSTSKQPQLDNNNNALYSAWVYTRFSDSKRADMNKKIQFLQQKIMQKRPHIECTFKLKIYLPEQHRLSEEITEDLIEGISKLSINPFISHQEKMFSQQRGVSDGLLFNFDNSLFFNS